MRRPQSAGSDPGDMAALGSLFDAAHEAPSLEAFLGRSIAIVIEQLGCDAVTASCADEVGTTRRVSARREGDSRARGAHPLVIELPLVARGRSLGACTFVWERRDGAPAKTGELAASWSKALGAALGSRITEARLRERVKELECLYDMANLAVRDDLSLLETLFRVAEMLPAGWRHPGLARARIVLDGQVAAAPDFREGAARQVAEIVIRDRIRGRVEMHYPAGWAHENDDPFLPEEGHLLESIAAHLAGLIDRREAEEERRRLEEQLRRADRLATLGQLAAGMAHEINEPLASIVGFTQLAAQHPGIPDSVNHDLEHALGAALHAREIVRKLMWFARRVPPSVRAVNANVIVQEALSFVERRSVRQRVEIVRELAPDLPEIEADPAQLRQVCLNLIVNAIQAMPEGGTLRLRTTAEPADVVLEVEDTGCGMTAEVRSRLFTPFFTTKDVGEGTGLGLAVSHGIVEAHGGSIRVDSAPGRGSRFEVRFPRQAAPRGGAGR